MAVVRRPKSIRIAFRATDEDGRMINALIERTGMAGSDVIRLAIRRLHSTEIEGWVQLPVSKVAPASLRSLRQMGSVRRKPRKKM
jgi:hypothetical protein